MAILRKNKRQTYTVIDNSVFKNYGLSYKAKGLLCQMLSLPDGWEFSAEGLAKLSCDGITVVRNALRELEEQHYLKRRQVRDENGKMAGREYVVSESPMLEKPISEKPMAEKPISENLTQLNTKESNTKELNTNTNTNKSVRFKPPTLEEVKNYIAEKQLNVDAEKLYEYYSVADWHDSKGKPVRNWKQRCLTWHKRSDDGYSRNNKQRNAKEPAAEELPDGWECIFGRG